jgi:hypothetical protein
MPSITSTAILRIDYDAFARELAITFVSGKTYVYSGVPAPIHRELTEAPSKGAYFNQHVRDHFRYRERWRHE